MLGARDDEKGEFAAQQLTGEGLDARTVTAASVVWAAIFPDGEPLPW